MTAFLPKIIFDYRKGLILGTGGGNDIVSALLPAHYLASQGIKVDVAGMCSPGALHTFSGKSEQPINELTADTKRFVANHTRQQIHYIDALLPNVVREKNIGTFYNFSMQYGSVRLRDDLNKLILNNGYEFILGVDVGGDILTRGRLDDTLLSPLMDLTALYLLKEANTNTYLLEFGLGTDGELRPAGMEEIINELHEKDFLISESSLLEVPESLDYFKKIYAEVSKTRQGRTAKYTLETLKLAGTDEDITTQYRFRNRFLNETTFTPFTVRLPSKFHGKSWLIDVKPFAQSRDLVLMKGDSLTSNYMQAKAISTSWNTELDGFAVYEKDWPSTLMMVLSSRIDKDAHNRMVQKAIDLVHEGLYDRVMLRQQEIPRVFDVSYDERFIDVYPNDLKAYKSSKSS